MKGIIALLVACLFTVIVLESDAQRWGRPRWRTRGPLNCSTWIAKYNQSRFAYICEVTNTCCDKTCSQPCPCGFMCVNRTAADRRPLTCPVRIWNSGLVKVCRSRPTPCLPDNRCADTSLVCNTATNTCEANLSTTVERTNNCVDAFRCPPPLRCRPWRGRRPWRPRRRWWG